MIKRNLASILIIISSLIGIMNVDYPKVSETKHFWLLIMSSFIILASIILIFNTESKNKKNKESVLKTNKRTEYGIDNSNVE